MAAECKAILCHLLRYCTASSDLLAFLLMIILHLDKLLEIKSPVFHKTTVLRGNYRPDHNRRNLIKVYPSTMIAIALQINILDTSLKHERSPCNRHDLI